MWDDRAWTRRLIIQIVILIENGICPEFFRRCAVRPGERLSTRGRDVWEGVCDDYAKVRLRDEQEEKLSPPKGKPPGTNCLPGVDEGTAQVLTEDEFPNEEGPGNEDGACQVGNNGRASSIRCNHIWESPDIANADRIPYQSKKIRS